MQTKIITSLFFAFIVSIPAIAQTYEKQYEICSQPLRSLKTVDSIYFEYLKKRDTCLTGTAAPDFRATTIDKEVIQLSKLKGQVVILNFWFTKCQPCINEMPDLNKLAALYSGKNVVFISFAPENAGVVKKFLSQHPFNFKTVANSEAIRQDQFKLFSGWPYTIVINKEGKISQMKLGSEENVFQYYQKIIDELL